MSCRLCGASAPLRDSHILPEFLYRPTYGAKHTAVFLEPAKQRKGRRQKGITERLLCNDCEKRFNVWETYFANVWLNPAKQLRPLQLPGDDVTVSGLDYAQFKLFHLSLVWRSGVSSRPEFANVSLGGQEPKLRDRLLASEPGSPADYPFFGFAIRDPTTGGFQDGLVKTPDVAKVDGHRVYTLFFGGVMWHYFISSHAGRSSVPTLFERNGELRLGVQDWTKNLFVLDAARQMRNI